ncbi:hypothetical protein DESC_480226 [Desulfosarcina cetonica]|nr:hypothetical protein DESC_480226 [Desulfosarcina cetonica]
MGLPAGRVGAAGPDQRGKLPVGRSLAGHLGEHQRGEGRQAFAFRGLEQIVHVRRIAAHMAHGQIVADGVQIVVGGVVVEVDRGGQNGGGFSVKDRSGVLLEYQLDKPFIARGDEKMVDRRGPEDGVGGPNFVHDGIESGDIPFQVPDAPGDMNRLQRMGGKVLCDIGHILQGHAFGAFGAAVEDDDVHWRSSSCRTARPIFSKVYGLRRYPPAPNTCMALTRSEGA